MNNTIFRDENKYLGSAYIGWQDQGDAFEGIQKGYKNSADDLVNLVLEKGEQGRIEVLDTYIFPIVHSYRHSIEISLKKIYYRAYGKNTQFSHSIKNLWEKFLKNKLLLDLKINLKKELIQEIDKLIGDLEGVDRRGDVWRYLIDKNGEEYFKTQQKIDYINLKENVNKLYEDLDYIYYLVDRKLS